MSQHKLRKDSNCLNCGQHVEKHYCTNCGQENREPYESVWGFTTHFVADILHWDGKFFRTIKKLFLNPGGLSADYVAGKRAAYVVPIRMYLICSVAFGLAFSFHMKHFGNRKQEANNKTSVEINLTDLDTIDGSSTSAYVRRAELLNDAEALREFDWRDSVDKSKPNKVVINPKTGNITGNVGWSSGGKIMIPYGLNLQNVDSAIRESKKIIGHNTDFEQEFEYMLIRYFVQKKAKHPTGNMNLNKAVQEELVHSLPKSFFILMPFFALVLYILYYRRKYYYYQHMVFTLHYYCVALLVYSLLPFVSTYIIAAMVFLLLLCLACQYIYTLRLRSFISRVMVKHF